MDKDIKFTLKQLEGVNLYSLRAFTQVRRSEHYDISCSIFGDLPVSYFRVNTLIWIDLPVLEIWYPCYDPSMLGCSLD